MVLCSVVPTATHFQAREIPSQNFCVVKIDQPILTSKNPHFILTDCLAALLRLGFLLFFNGDRYIYPKSFLYLKKGDDMKKWLMALLLVLVLPSTLAYKINLDCNLADENSLDAQVTVGNQAECYLVLALDSSEQANGGVNGFGAEFNVQTSTYNFFSSSPTPSWNLLFKLSDGSYGSTDGATLNDLFVGSAQQRFDVSQQSDDLRRIDVAVVGVQDQTPAGLFAKLTFLPPTSIGEYKLYLRNPVFGYVDDSGVVQEQVCTVTTGGNPFNCLTQFNDATGVTISVVAASAGILGDADGNGQITSVDALMTLKSSLGITVPDSFSVTNADVSYCQTGQPARGTGISSIDALMILKIALGIDVNTATTNVDFLCS